MKLNTKYSILTVLAVALISTITIAKANHQDLKREVMPPKAVMAPTGSLDINLLVEREKRISLMIDAATSERAGSFTSNGTAKRSAVEDEEIRKAATKPL